MSEALDSQPNDTAQHESADMLTMQAQLEQLKAENAELKQQVEGLTQQVGELVELLRSKEATAHSSSEAPEASKTEKTPDEAANGVLDTDDLAEFRKLLADEDAQNAYVPKHRAENTDEDSPIADAIQAERGESSEVALEGESLEEYEARQPGRHTSGQLNNPSDRMQAIINGTALPTSEASAAQTGESNPSDRMQAIIDAAGSSEGEPTIPRSRGQRVRDALRQPDAVVAAWAAGRAERQAGETDPGQSKTRRRLSKAALFLVGAGIGAGATYLRFRGQEVPASGSGLDLQQVLPGSVIEGGGSGNSGTTNGGTGGAGHDQLRTVRVNSGDGEIKVTQHILEQAGIHVNASDAERIGRMADVDLLVGDKNYDDASSALNRIGGAAGVYKIRPDSADALVQAADRLGFKRAS